MKKNKVIISFLLLINLCFCLYLYKSNNILALSYNENKSIDEIYFDRWKEKSWLTLGDSITKPNIYQEKVKNYLDFSYVHNKGINGQTMAFQNKNTSTYDLGKNIDYTKYDLVTIFIGTNDFRYNKKLGNINNIGSNNFDKNTFTGGYQLLIEKILSCNPNVDLVLITPLQRNKDGYNTTFTNLVDCNLIDYVNVIKKLGEMYSLPVLDLYATSKINEFNLDIYTRDGLHPNKTGYDCISDQLFRFLLNI